jgi:hypothetical protein
MKKSKKTSAPPLGQKYPGVATDTSSACKYTFGHLVDKTKKIPD